MCATAKDRTSVSAVSPTVKENEKCFSRSVKKHGRSLWDSKALQTAGKPCFKKIFKQLCGVMESVCKVLSWCEHIILAS